MNLQESIRRILKEETNHSLNMEKFQKLVNFEMENIKDICRTMDADYPDRIISFDACDFIGVDPIVEVTNYDKIGNRPRLHVVIKYDNTKYLDERSFVSELQRLLRKWITNVLVKVEDVIFGGNDVWMKETEIVKEGTDIKQKLQTMIKDIGVVKTSNAVGGFDNLNKILNLDLDDIDVQEMLVKNFIYFYDLNEVEVLSLEVKRSASGGRIIIIYGTTTDPAVNVDSWYVNNICDDFNKFFPFEVSPSWRPVFTTKGVKIFLNSYLKLTDNLQESIKNIVKEETNFKKRLQSMIKDVDIRGISNMIGGFDNFKRVMNIQSPMDYLNLFNDLDMVQSMEDSDLILFRYKPKENILMYDKPLNKVYISYDEIFSILRSEFKLNELEINFLVSEWLEKVYNLQGVKIGNAIDTWRFFKNRII